MELMNGTKVVCIVMSVGCVGGNWIHELELCFITTRVLQSLVVVTLYVLFG
mgnify:CR=1 FL=1